MTSRCLGVTRPFFYRATVGRLLFALLTWAGTAMAFPQSAFSQDPLPGSVQGRVWDEEGAPVQAVLIRAFQAGTERVLGGAESDDLGYYQIDRLSPGSYLLEVSRLGFATRTFELQLSSGQRVTADFVLTPVILEVEGI